MKKLTTVAVTLVLITVFSAAAFAWRGGHAGSNRGYCGGPYGAQGYHGAGFFQQWDDLSAQQKKAIMDLHQKFIDETAALRADMLTKQGKIRILLGTSNPDADALDKLVNGISDLRGKIMERRIDFILKAKKVAPGFDFKMGYGNMPGLFCWSGGKYGSRGFDSGIQGMK